MIREVKWSLLIKQSISKWDLVLNDLPLISGTHVVVWRGAVWIIFRSLRVIGIQSLSLLERSVTDFNSPGFSLFLPVSQPFAATLIQYILWSTIWFLTVLDSIRNLICKILTKSPCTEHWIQFSFIRFKIDFIWFRKITILK